MSDTPRFTEDPPRKHFPWVWLILLVVAGGFGYLIVHRLMHPPVAAPARPSAEGRTYPVDVAVARPGEMELYLRELGTVTPLNTVTVHTRVDGQLINVAFTEGQYVEAGQLLAEIDPRPFQVMLTAAQGQLAKDQAQLQNANLDLKRYQNLMKQNLSVTQQQVDTQQSLVKQFEGAVTSDQSQIDSANLQLTYCHVTAPFAGRIGLRLVDQGNIVHASDATGLAVITQVQPIAVIFSISEDEISRVMKENGPQKKLVVEAYDRDDKEKIATGELSAIDNQADPTTAMIRLKAVFPNEDNALFPNEFVRAWLLVQTLKDALQVPDAAIQHGPDNSIFVYVVKEDQTVELQNVTVGPSEGGQTVIASGLSPGQTVVTAGMDKLQSGYKVAASGARGGRGGRGGRGRGGSASQPATMPGATRGARSAQ
ncbi:MAG TPA: MdtA/MuxA family multidrug efflux RND transporter periplasmic adaptor subunit [Humisphaera sp.]|nr:MdtA/MuxA family multidrug efflux RND transporter periplasmic adaptor subunit [Humisphaera sp.]